MSEDLDLNLNLKALRMSAKAMTSLGERDRRAVRRLARRTLNAVDELARLRRERADLLEACHGGPGFATGAMAADLEELAHALDLMPEEIPGLGSSTIFVATRLRTYAETLRTAVARAAGQPGGEGR